MLFPELSLTGYETDLAPELAFAPDDARLDPLVEATASNSMIVIAGAPMRCGSRLHIGALIIRPEGSVDFYTKHRLGAFGLEAACDGIVPPADATVFEPGGRDPLVCYNGHVGAVAVCAQDARSIPCAPRRAARGLTSKACSSSRRSWRVAERNMRTYAREHRMAVVMANFGGPRGALWPLPGGAASGPIG